MPVAPQPRQWRTRIVLGRAERNAATPPATPLAASLEMWGIDGGDFDLGRSEGYPDRPVSGGDFDSGDLVLYPFPRYADGGFFDTAYTQLVTSSGDRLITAPDGNPLIAL